MALSDTDCRDILTAIRRRVQEMGLRNIDDRILRDGEREEDAFRDLQSYLRQLAGEISIGGEVRTSETLRRLREFARTEEGGAIEGIIIELSPADAQRYGRDTIDLLASAEFDRLAKELRTLMGEIERERHRGRERGKS
jgi:hypothetical protein